MLTYFIDERKRITLEDNIEWNGNFPSYQELIPHSNRNSVMYYLLYNKIQNYLYWKFPKENILQIADMTHKRVMRVIHCWDGKPEISESYKDFKSPLSKCQNQRSDSEHAQKRKAFPTPLWSPDQ
jgi:hypothetical protein